MKNVAQNDLLKVRTAIPSINEQSRVSEQLSYECNEIDEVSRRISQSVSILREYRTALITAAVTGQLDVDQLADAQLVAHA
jgi:type I restriction enzyme S subunit